MNRRECIVSLTALFLAACSQEIAQTRLVIVGDSTAASFPRFRAPMMGWGQALQEKCDNRLLILNHAVAGASSKSYYKEFWAKTLGVLHMNDFVLIQFGHNDQSSDPERYTEPEGLFRTTIAALAQETIAAGARPVLVTPIPRCIFSEGKLLDTHGRYPATVRAVASELQLPLIDMTKIAAEAIERIGEKRGREWFMAHYDGHDNVHLNRAGAEAIAEMFIREFARIGIV